MQPHFMVASNGDLFDTRESNWSSRPPLRAGFARTCKHIESVADLKSTLRAGSSTDLGGYPLYFVASDGESLSFEAVRDNVKTIMDSIAHGHRDGWRVVAVDINYEDSDMVCGHTGKPIASAYGSDESDVESADSE